MSFKREGDDKSQLNILKKRRVADLLSHFIPEDEATLLKNGRYTCLVCSYRPVFDTVDTLTIHRQGKKHLEGMQKFYGKKAELKNEIAKRKHETYIQTEDRCQGASSSAPLLAKTRKLTHHALLKTVPYNSCHRKTSTKSDKTPASNSSHPSGNTANKMSPAYWKTEATNQLSTGSSSSCVTVDNEESGKNTAADLYTTITQASEPMTSQRRSELEHFLKLKSDGWLQDRSGQWVKDENVEFDSDEEEPATLASSQLKSDGEN